MTHPILAIVAIGGLLYSFSSICPRASRWLERLCYGVNALSGMVVSLAGLDDFPDLLLGRYTPPRAIAALPELQAAQGCCELALIWGKRQPAKPQ